MTEQWQELKETITEMRDNDGTGTQQEICKFLANYMDILEKQMQEPKADVSWGDIRKAYLKGYDYGVKDWLKYKTQPCEDAVSREEVLNALDRVGNLKMYENCDLFAEHYAEYVRALPSVKPKYTDEEIDKIQEIEQAYVDKMVEIAVEETKERYSDAIGKMKKAIDEMTEIHSDGEFYIKNVDAKWIISKYLCGAKEKPKGRWIATENEEMNIVGYYCSCCDLPMETEEKTKYCPNCGAYMGGGEDEVGD